MTGETNAVKANVIAAVNALLALCVAFGVPLSDAQVAAVVAAFNTLALLYVSLTYKKSHKRRA